MTLYIDATNNLQTTVRLGKHKLVKKYSSPREQNVLGAIDEILKKHHKTFQDLTSIEVNPGPGSFTGTRVGVSVANALSFALNIKVNNQTPPIMPVYDKPPNITKPR